MDKEERVGGKRRGRMSGDHGRVEGNRVPHPPDQGSVPELDVEFTFTIYPHYPAHSEEEKQIQAMKYGGTDGGRGCSIPALGGPFWMGQDVRAPWPEGKLWQWTSVLGKDTQLWGQSLCLGKALAPPRTAGPFQRGNPLS